MLLAFIVFSCDTEPLEGEFSSTPDGTDPEEFCANAGLAIADAQLAFLDASETNAQALCENLRNTIESVITNCGDPGGMFQAFLDGIGNDCSNVPDVGDTDNTGAGQFSANIDGLPFSASGQNTGAFFTLNTFNVSGINPSTGEMIVITVQNVNGPGTFDLTISGNGAIAGGAYVPETGSNAFVSDISGTLTITELDLVNNITSGTFEFVGTEALTGATVDITEGVFSNLNVQTEAGGDPTSTLNVDVDGIPMSPDSVVGIESTTAGVTTIAIVANNNATNQNLSLTFPVDIVPGTYEFDFFPTSPDAIIGSYNPDLSVMDMPLTVSANAGSLIITNNDPVAGLVEGTFEFTGEPFPGTGMTETFELTNGEFSVSY